MVPTHEVEQLMADEYPHRKQMFQHSPKWFRLIAERTMCQLGLDFASITVGNVWMVFDQMLPPIRAELAEYTYTSSSSPESIQDPNHESVAHGSPNSSFGSSSATVSFE
jgi:hypothetical protein